MPALAFCSFQFLFWVWWSGNRLPNNYSLKSTSVHWRRKIQIWILFCTNLVASWAIDAIRFTNTNLVLQTSYKYKSYKSHKYNISLAQILLRPERLMQQFVFACFPTDAQMHSQIKCIMKESWKGKGIL